MITKGAPETVLERCTAVPDLARNRLADEFAHGCRVIAVASRPFTGDTLTHADETGLTLVGFLVYSDPPKVDAADALNRLAGLGIAVKVVTGDNAEVARAVCVQLGLSVQGVLNGAQIEALY